MKLPAASIMREAKTVLHDRGLYQGDPKLGGGFYNAQLEANRPPKHHTGWPAIVGPVDLYAACMIAAGVGGVGSTKEDRHPVWRDVVPYLLAAHPDATGQTLAQWCDHPKTTIGDVQGLLDRAIRLAGGLAAVP